ncbi:MAG: adenosine-specific kinase [Bacteroidota bacterium]|nr:adenosine-specific kinase [Bacteroidota bacterium]
MDVTLVRVEKPEDVNVILGQSHFIKTVEDLYEAIVQTNPAIRFGIGFCEASGKRLVRWAGNDEEMIDFAKRNAWDIGAGHSFIVFLRNGFPINVLNAIKALPEVVGIFCATANPVDVLVAERGEGRGIIGVIDGARPLGIEDTEDVEERKLFLRKIGYKF